MITYILDIVKYLANKKYLIILIGGYSELLEAEKIDKPRVVE